MKSIGTSGIYREIKKTFEYLKERVWKKNTRVEGEALIESWQGCSY